MSTHKTIKASQLKTLKVKSLKDLDLEGFDEYKSSIDLNNKKKIIKSLLAMFEAGNYDAFMELTQLYIDHVGKREIAKRAKIPEKTIYNFKDGKHKTSSENIFKIMKAIGQA